MNEKEEIAEKEEERILLKLKTSRKAFLVEYLCGFFLLGLLFFLKYKGVTLNERIIGLTMVVGFFAIASAEVSRYLHRCEVTGSKLVVIEGLLKKEKKHVYFFSLGFVPDINVKQSITQRLLNYGSIFVKGTGIQHFEIKKIDMPHKIMKTIEELIEKNKKHGRR